MEPKVIKLNSFQVMGYHFEANLQEIEKEGLGKKTLLKLQENADQFINKSGDHIYLVQIYPMKENFNANVDKFTQIIGFEVSDSSNIPEGAILHTLEENLYVKYTHRGLEADLHKTYDYLYGKWLMDNGYFPIGYDAELWDERYKPFDPENEIDLFIPVKKQ
ncbi:AraC family transcriptional regulator [Bacillus sp. Bva_UNVM-123]|uniref:GyrI-like domain-containing protein n=1 Tax=Bacillus sp. Bva_UNVM-123 TaxID=2829798 RepID=UPI00391F2491